jgi:hypothetical protein
MSFFSALPTQELPVDQHRMIYEHHGFLLTEWSFDDSFEPYCNPNVVADTDIFGESYTIVWIVPPDLEAVVAALMQRVQENLQEGENICAGHLWRLWEDCLERASVYTRGGKINAWKFLLDVKDALEQQLNALPHGPSASDWDNLDELLMK